MMSSAGSIALPYIWLLSVIIACIGLVLYLSKRTRPLGIAIALISGSFAGGFWGLDKLRPPPVPSVLQQIVEGPFVRIQFRAGTTLEQENAFLCEFIYSECTESGHDFRLGVTGITRTASTDLTIGTTPEFQMDLQDIVSKAAIVEAAVAGSK